MRQACNDNGSGGWLTRVLEARFHPRGIPGEYIVIGRVFCRDPWAVLEVAPHFERQVPDNCSPSSIISNLTYLTLLTRPRPYDGLLSIDNRFWSFAVADVAAHPPDLG